MGLEERAALGAALSFMVDSLVNRRPVRRGGVWEQCGRRASRARTAFPRGFATSDGDARGGCPRAWAKCTAAVTTARRYRRSQGEAVPAPDGHPRLIPFLGHTITFAMMRHAPPCRTDALVEAARSACVGRRRQDGVAREQVGELDQALGLGPLVVGEGLAAVLAVEQGVEAAVDALGEREARDVLGNLDCDDPSGLRHG